MRVVRAQRLVAERLMTGTGRDARLLGTRCNSCGTVTFPEQASCPACTALDTCSHVLAESGPLWSFTVQAFEPKAPYRRPAVGFSPYGVGYVNLGNEILVEGRLTVADAGSLRIGMEMRVHSEVFAREADGTDLVTYAFSPLNGSDS